MPLLLTIVFVCKLALKNITHADSELPLIGMLSFSLFELIWLSFPYVIMLHFFNKHVTKVEKIYLDYIAICIVSGLGLIMILNIGFVHPDAQGPIAIQIIPLIQFGIYALFSAAINKMRSVQPLQTKMIKYFVKFVELSLLLTQYFVQVWGKD